MDFISVATPNHTHFPIAKAALEAGFNVICDKPMTFDLAQAEELQSLVEKSGAVFALTHNYTGYPLVRQARQMIKDGELGEIKAIRSNYIQGWLRARLEQDDQKQAAWRTDPAKSGAAGAFGDIGTHAYNLSRYITGLIPSEISCNLKIFAPGRKLDDYGHAVIRFENGALGTVTASQISHGRENDLFIEIDGTEGAISWRQEEPNQHARPQERQAASALHPRSERPVSERVRLRRLPVARRPPGRLFSKPSPTCTARRMMPSSNARAGKRLKRRTRFIPTSTTAWTACTSSSNASPAATKTGPGCR